MTLVVGLTGGIGSGKSTVAGMFEDLGVPVIDADVIAREVVAPGSEGLKALVEDFGPGIVDASGRLDRPRLKTLVFADPGQREKLESILHPRIRARIEDMISGVTAPYCIVSVPLLIESGWTDLVDRVLVVDLPEDMQRQRTMDRDRLTAGEVEAIMRVQATRGGRLMHATEVVVNDRDRAFLQAQVAALHQLYSRSSKQR
jgi:dephospho-CoA kinase